MNINLLVWTWILIAASGLTVSAINLIDALRVLRWQWKNEINGMRRLLALGHVRTAHLRTIELGAALAVGVFALFPGREPRWLPVVLLFVIVAPISVASVMDYRDRHKLVEE